MIRNRKYIKDIQTSDFRLRTSGFWLRAYISLISFICLSILNSHFSLLKAQCTLGFDLKPDMSYYCTSSDTVFLTAWDTLNTGGCTIAPSFVFKVLLDNNSINDNYVDFYKNSKKIQTINNANAPAIFKNNTWLSLLASYLNKNNTFAFDFCDKAKNGSFKYMIIDRASKAIVLSGTINGSDGCTRINVPKVKGIATFSGTGVKNYTDGTGMFNAATAGPGTHVITYNWDNENGFNKSITRTVIVKIPPPVKVKDTVILKGTTASLKATGASSYKWSNGSTANPLIVSPIITTTYTVSGTDASLCVAIDTVIVTVVTAPIITVNNPTLCIGDSVILTAQGADSYKWSTGENTASITVKPLTITSYTVTGTSSYGFTGNATATVTVVSLPLITVNNPEICNGVSVNLTANNAITYTWSNGVTASSIIVSPITTSTYTVTGTDNYGCKASASSVVTVLPIVLSPALSSNDPVCSGSSLTLFAVYNDTLSNITYQWSGPNGFSSVSQNPTIDNISISQQGLYYATTIYKNCNSIPSSIDISVITNPNNFLPQNYAICSGELIEIKPIYDYIRYLWLDGSDNSTLSINFPGLYWLSVTDKNGCTGTDSTYVSNNCPPVIAIPNSFSPYSKNDTFAAKGENISSFDMKIFNRWGSLIFHSENIKNGWDGKLSNSDSQIETYIYVIEYEGIVNNDKTKTKKIGYIKLIR